MRGLGGKGDVVLISQWVSGPALPEFYLSVSCLSASHHNPWRLHHLLYYSCMFFSARLSCCLIFELAVCLSFIFYTWKTPEDPLNLTLLKLSMLSFFLSFFSFFLNIFPTRHGPKKLGTTYALFSQAQLILFPATACSHWARWFHHNLSSNHLLHHWLSAFWLMLQFSASYHQVAQQRFYRRWGKLFLFCHFQIIVPSSSY